ncbi:hypothetical protein HB912_10715 [Listeria aquatica]|uniref:Uncharacterized protein n=1 Tax=Listeria aquatica TaxID=1494960 RepID=A0A841ZS69_9LIST|nr:hypothetical protein [Listeria aquatica]MBC1522118.1 hypothetical protein [Listeria aquatica]
MVYSINKKINNTTGYTAYIIAATKSGFYGLNTKLTYDSKSKKSSVLPYKSPKSYGGVFILIIMVRKDILHVVLVHNIGHEWNREQPVQKQEE